MYDPNSTKKNREWQTLRDIAVGSKITKIQKKEWVIRVMGHLVITTNSLMTIAPTAFQ